jgi:hypothetical protein
MKPSFQHCRSDPHFAKPRLQTRAQHCPIVELSNRVFAAWLASSRPAEGNQKATKTYIKEYAE